MSRRSRIHDTQVVGRLPDARGHRVLLVSHCLLNQNTRYAGGATRPGAIVEEVEELMRTGCGIHQLPCPERRAWGGVLKRHTLPVYGSRGRPLYVARDPLRWFFVRWTRRVYRRLARQVVRDVADYERAGITVSGIVGVGSSPSCGVLTTLDLRASLEVVAACPVAALTPEVVNDRAVLACRRSGQGMFIEALDRELRRAQLHLPSFEHDLAAELAGETQSPLTSPGRALGG